MTFTNMTYSEFDSTQQTLLHDIRQAILASASWTQPLNVTTPLTTVNGNAGAGATNITLAAAPGSVGIVVGSVIRLGADGGAGTEYRTVTNINGNQITVAATTYAHNTGENVYVGNELLACQTTRGANLIVDLNSNHWSQTNGQQLNVTFWGAHTGAFNSGGSNPLGPGIGSAPASRFVPWRNGASSAASDPVHVIVSASKEHLYVSLEGPRAAEAHPDSATYGSQRNYLLMCDLVPYFAGDTQACAYAWASPAGSGVGDGLGYNGSQIGFLTLNEAGNGWWGQCRLASLCLPAVGSVGSSQNVQRAASEDSNWYLFPYVAFSDLDGMRGRLAAFFFAGYAQPDFGDAAIPTPPIGSKITYNGQLYKLLPVSKSSSNSNPRWGPLGIAMNAPNQSPNCSVVVAVPCT
jgi:hypothetical protein